MYFSDFTFQIIKYIQVLQCIRNFKTIPIKELAGIYVMGDDLRT